MHSTMIQLLTLAMAAVVFVPLFRRVGLGAILAYLVAGVIIGPDMFGFITDTQDILHFSELGVVFLLFVIGLELAPSKLWSMRHAIFGLGTLQVVVSGVLLMGIGLLCGLPLPLSYIGGFGLALSSTAFTMQLLDDNNQKDTSHGRDTFAILMFQDIAVVAILASLSLFTGKGEGFQITMAIKAISLIVFLILIGHYVIRHVLRLVADSNTPEVFTAMSLLIVVGTAILMESVGLSMGMGAFFAGVLLANSEYRHELEIDLAPFKNLLLGLFFTAVGMSLDLETLGLNFGSVVLLTGVFMIVKGIVVFAVARLFRRSLEVARNTAFNIALGGEFAFVLFSSAVSQKLMSADNASILNASVTISMALTPILFILNQKYLRRFSEISERPYDDIAPADVEVIVAGFGRFGQIVTRFLNAEGVTYTILDHNASQVETARQFGNKVYYGDASRHDILEAAGAKKAKYLVLAIDDVEASIETARVVREHYPSLEIIARVRNRAHAIELMEMGIKSVHRETYMTSLEVAKEVMLKRGKPAEAVDRAIRNFRIYDERILLKQMEYHHDETQLISFTSKATKDLERILTEDRDSEEFENIDAQ